uniref:DNA topoisomerase n=1 Tax=viral metagenome TaxID=1070528 RepID=A0A6C0F4G1_9ZZZZ|tara:strand:+ start:2731 stop:4824 length:2094 start_codon:yes stop_codon:yes gene_type:complete
MSILITESPAKAKKIQGFFPNNRDYCVKSSCGHIRDLYKKKTTEYGIPINFGIDVENDFKAKYIILSDKKEVVKQLKQYSKDREVILAADDDREGEAIAWHVAKVLNVNVKKTKRIVFREISKKAILKSLETPTVIDINQVNSQQARRIIDRLIGFLISPCLWKNIDSNVMGLSAGRVQSALLNLLEERENQINNYETEIQLDIFGQFDKLEKSEFFIDPSCEEDDFDDEFIDNLFKKFNKNRTFKVESSSIKKNKVYPDKPFITSSLQQTAQKHGFTIKKTMNIAQSLYESGHITYMRTDSTFISDDFQKKIKHKIVNDFGKGYFSKPLTKKVMGAQEAHEAIRVTSIEKPELDGEFKTLYNMIYDRTIISHMKPAEYDVHKLLLKNKETKTIGYFESNYRQLIFPGFKIYNNKDITVDNKPSFTNEYVLNEAYSNEKEGVKPTLYDEGGIVNLLEKTGIGRPSTYSSIISTLDNRNYTVKENVKAEDIEVKKKTLHKDGLITNKIEINRGKVSKNRILLTPLGSKVLKYLQDNFMNIICKDFTVRVETDLDLIACGKLNYIDVIKKVYKSFITKAQEQIKTVKYNTSNLKKLGHKKGLDIFIGSGKYGAYLHIVNKDKTHRNINISKYLKIIKKNNKTLTFDEAVNFLKYPKKINDDITVYIGTNGYYMKCKTRTYSIKQDGDYTEEYCRSILSG